ncbi:MAG TPA: quinoprotein dehydrogenase-associated putative ABC transporter substrate-binding protein [Kofleriaceae bacterium]|nr:quinoprotein dehydrogenase-associated putative ABC transporter substrate-binding protein [Kofleriaceae bacterium]
MLVVALVAALVACGQPAGGAPVAPVAPLRVCADPNNLPFSNRARAGFENALAELVAHALGREVAYTWFPQRRGFIKNTLKAGKCDLVIGVPAGYELAATTRPYYRSTYVFVSRADRRLDIHALDDPRLRELRIGVHALGDDYANVPPAQALSRHGLERQLVGYSFFGDYAQPDPPRALIDAVARGEVDLAIAWGPLAGWAAAHAAVPLVVTPIDHPADEPLPFSFAIAMGVRKDEPVLRAAVDAWIARRGPAIADVLDRFAIPRVPGGRR